MPQIFLLKKGIAYYYREHADENNLRNYIEKEKYLNATVKFEVPFQAFGLFNLYTYSYVKAHIR